MQLDSVAQRQILTAFFAAIQALKVYDAVFGDSPFYSFVQWCSVDILFLGFLRLLKVPKLSFSKVKNIIFAVILVLLNVAVFYGRMDGIISINSAPPAPFNNIMDVPQEDDFNYTHILGSHTVKLVHLSSAVLNSQGDSFCYPLLKEKIAEPSVFIPIEFKGNSPWSVEVSIHDLNDKKISSFKETFASSSASIRIQQPGKYKISSLVDGKNMNGKFSDAFVIVSVCPSAQFNHEYGKKEYCLNEKAEIFTSLMVKAMLPAQVFVETEEKDKKTQMVFKVPSGSEDKNGFPISFPMPSTSGPVLLRITKVIDKDMKEHVYDKVNFGDRIVFHVNEEPSASFSDSLLFKSKSSESDQRLLLKLKGNYPITVEYETFLKGKETAKLSKKILNSSQAFIPVIGAGTYKLLSIKDDKCDGKVTSPQSKLVEFVDPPKMAIEYEPTASICTKNTGVNVNLNFEGQAPFIVQYRELFDGKLMGVGKHKSDGKRSVFKWNLAKTGLYSLEFFSLSDANYNQVSILEAVEQSIHALPTAVFQKTNEMYEGHRLISCGGKSQTVHVLISEGKGPWNVLLQLDSPAKEKTILEFNTADAILPVTIESFDSFGSYSLSIKSITDASGCKNDSLDQIIIIESMAEDSFVAFASTGSAILKEGILSIHSKESESIFLPLNFSGPLPFDILYSVNGIKKNFKLTEDNLAILATQPGRFELLSAKDKYCSSKIIAPSVYSVLSIPKPTAKFSEKAEKVRFCYSEQKSDSLMVSVSGSFPITLSYSEEYNGQARKFDLNVPETNQEIISIPLSFDRIPGKYIYRLLSVSDHNYRNVPLHSSEVIHEIMSEPRLNILNPEGVDHYCLGSDLTASVELFGDSPMSIKYDVVNESGVIASHSVKDLAQGRHDLKIDGSLLSASKVSIEIKEVSDQNGCRILPDNLAKLKKSFYIENLPLISLSAEDSCVGDLLHLSIEGSGPWKLTYLLGDEVVEKEFDQNNFSIRLRKAGLMKFTRICNKVCCRNLETSHIVYDLPTAMISQGKNTLEEMQEGQATSIKVDLMGEKPFSFTYQRILESTKDFLETFTVTDVNDNVYYIQTSEEGTYRLTWIKDKRCQFPKLLELFNQKQLKCTLSCSMNYLLAKTYFDTKDFMQCSFQLQNEAVDDNLCYFLLVYSQYMNIKMSCAASCKRELQDLLQSMEEDRDEDAFIAYLKALLSFETDDYSGCIELALQSINTFSFNWSMWTLLGSALSYQRKVFHLHNMKACESVFERLPNNFMRDFFVLWAHNEYSLQFNENLNEIISSLKAKFRNSLFLSTQEALVNYWNKDFDAAMQNVQLIMEREPYRLDSLDILSNIFYVREDVKNLSMLAMKAAAINKFRPETNCILGNYFSLKRDHDKALKYFHRGSKLSPNSWWFWTLIGHEYIELKNINAAIESYRKTIDLNPNDFRAWYVLGQFYQLLKMPCYALVYYKKACDIRPNDSRMWIALGNCYLSLQQSSEAVIAFRRAEAHDDTTTALHQLAKLYQDRNEHSLAFSYYKKLVCKKESSQTTDSEYYSALLMLGSYCKDSKKYQDAINYLMKIMDCSGSKPKLYSTKYILFPENKLAPDKMLYLVGLGLYDEKDVTLRGHEIIKKCDKVYLEAYTSILMISKARLEEFYGKKIIEADRDMVELQAEDILESAKNQDVALLVVGDPFSATTHSDIVLRAFSLGIKVQSVHNASILTAIGDTGLFLYNFGPTISIPFFTDNWKPASFYHKLKENMDKKYHTLCLLDIKVKEQSEENLSKGKKIYEPPRFMSVSTAVSQLLFLEDQEKLGLVSLESKAIAVARLGSPDQKIVYGTFKELLNFDMGSPLHSLIVPGELHEIELEMLSYFRINN